MNECSISQMKDRLTAFVRVAHLRAGGVLYDRARHAYLGLIRQLEAQITYLETNVVYNPEEQWDDGRQPISLSRPIPVKTFWFFNGPYGLLEPIIQTKTVPDELARFRTQGAVWGTDDVIDDTLPAAWFDGLPELLEQIRNDCGLIFVPRVISTVMIETSASGSGIVKPILSETQGGQSTTKIASVDAGSQSYWAERRSAFRLIRKVELAEENAKFAPAYIFGGYDENDDAITVENLEPERILGEAVRALEADSVAVNILVAQGRTRIGDTSIDSVLLAMGRDHKLWKSPRPGSDF